MDANLMAFNDWMEVEKDKVRWAAVQTTAYTTLVLLEKDPPQVEGAIAHLKHMIGMAEHAREAYRESDDKKE